MKKFRILERLRAHGVYAASPAIADDLEALSVKYPEPAAELLDALTTDPYPERDVKGPWGQYGRFRDSRDLIGQGEAWMWHVPDMCKVIYKRSDNGPVIMRVRPGIG
jgi:hypothetical protein